MDHDQTILFAADFSARSRAAFDVACSLADEATTRIVALHVVEPGPVPEPTVSFGELGLMDAEDESGLGYRERLELRLRRYYVPHRPVELEYRVAVGTPADVVLRTAEEVGADLIVMGSHGRSGMRRLLAGSVAESVLRRSRYPVLALSSLDAPPTVGEPAVVLHPTDFSALSEAATRLARALARDRGARLVLVHVVSGEVIPGSVSLTLMALDNARDALEALRLRLDGPDLKYPVDSRLCRGDAAGEILRVAEQEPCELIVMGSHGRSGFGRLLAGSVAESVLRRSPCPVLIVKPPSPEPAASPAAPAIEAAATS
ncbi:MAG TPA: universal stress protein [Isosphaeraceae bacterium]|jgi:nucleotide-binding universal stress UspA family protein|nr:universal stress protein [Isosphaeraceae bacterium]